MTLQEIEQLVAQYAPVVRLYNVASGLSYLPSSVDVYLAQVQYVQVDGTQSQTYPPPASGRLRPGDAGKTDFLKIPGEPGTPGYDAIANGSLQHATAYVHFVDLATYVGHGWFDIEYFFFYPFNGPGSAYAEFSSTLHDTTATARFKLFGEHEGDWEHVTLRFFMVDSVPVFTGMYFSQHSDGQWVARDEIEYNAQGRPYVYSSRDGHASYVNPGIYPTKDGPNIGKSFGVGPLKIAFSGFLANDCRKNTVEWDTLSAHQLVAVSNVPTISFTEPQWLQFLGRWGSVWTNAERQTRANGALQDIVDRIVGIVPGFAQPVASSIGTFVAAQVRDKLDLNQIVPDGPTGPKDKAAWVQEEGDGPSSGWSMKVVNPNGNVRVVLQEMQDWVTAHEAVPALIATAKLAADNQRHGDARGVIFFYWGDLPRQPVVGKNW